MVTHKLFRACAKAYEKDEIAFGAVSGIVATVVFATFPLSAAAAAAFVGADAAISATIGSAKALKNLHDKAAKKREAAHEARAAEERRQEDERRRAEATAKKPKPPTKQQRVARLHLDLQEKIDLIELSPLPPEDKVAFQNREIELLEEALRRILEDKS